MKQIKINCDALEKILASRGTNPAEVCVENGYSRSYFPTVKKRGGYIAMPLYKVLTAAYNIDPESIKPTKEAKAEQAASQLNEADEDAATIDQSERIVNALENIGKLQAEILVCLSDAKKSAELSSVRLDALLTKNGEIASKLNKFHYEWKNNVKYGTR